MGMLDGKVVIVTGGGHGIGRAYSQRIAKDGASVVVADIDEQAAREVAGDIEELGGRALAVKVDVVSLESARSMAAAAVERYGGMDGIVNNAAIFATIPIARVGFEAIDEVEWDRVMEVNVKGIWQCCKAVVPLMRERGGGSIVNISSSTIFNGSPTRVHYVASKAAVIGITRVLARELGDDNIRVNAIAPGNTLSEEGAGDDIVKYREAAAAARAIKRVQRPADLVGAIAFLLSDDAAFITGQTLAVDGGSVLH
jgi:3-oxoacyl-[acyl-carrier protein] reductase